MAERRRQQRIPVRIDGYWKSKGSKAGMGHVSNLSTGGCRLTTTLPLERGDRTILTLYFGRGGSITVQGRVVSGGSTSVGVKFENITSSLEFQIGEAMNRLIPTHI
jgi:hypothetical protein